MSAGLGGNCRICGSGRIGEMISVREMMFGTRERFDYFRCSDCGTMQIADFPADMSRHYSSSNYYSFNDARKVPLYRKLLARMAAADMVGRPERYPHGRSLIDRVRRGAEPWIARIEGLTLSSSVLDVGCGEGARLGRMAGLGFQSLAGVDPYLPADKAGRQASGVILRRAELSPSSERYDLITMHHSLEHFRDPESVLRVAGGLLKPGGRVYVAIPLLQDAVWDRFGASWAQLDAPRHFYLFSVGSFVALAARAGLACTARGFDGLGWSLAWSEAYAKDVPMYGPGGRQNALPGDCGRIESWEEEAKALNAQGRGDQGWFVLESSASASQLAG